jgi:AAA domain
MPQAEQSPTGNEDDYIIISVVRTDKIGFLREDRRANVMLSRCKKGMVLCTNKHFVQDLAKSTLVGKLAATMGPKAWLSSREVRYTDRDPFS